MEPLISLRKLDESKSSLACPQIVPDLVLQNQARLKRQELQLQIFSMPKGLSNTALQRATNKKSQLFSKKRKSENSRATTAQRVHKEQGHG